MEKQGPVDSTAAPAMTRKRRIHPVVAPNYYLRIVACASLLVINWAVWGSQLLTPALIWMPLAGLFWPHLARLLSVRASDGKRQEVYNMHADTALVAATCVVTPSFFYCTVVIAILVINTLFIGAYRLLFTNTLVFSAIVVFMLLLRKPDGFMDAGQPAESIIAVYLILYLACFGIIGHKLSSARVRLAKQVRQLSITDPLTGCFNRYYLNSNLPRELERGYRMGYPTSVIFMDVDHFKRINDQYGHSIGDGVLQQLVTVASQNTRENVDWLARFGGEEFVIVLPNAPRDVAARVAERIRRGVEDHAFSIEGIVLKVTASFGVATAEKNAPKTTSSLLLNDADEKLYRAKQNGRNRIEVDRVIAR